MEYEDTNPEVALVPRDKSGNSDCVFWGVVRNASRDGYTGVRYLTITDCDYLSIDSLVDICLESYYILEIRWRTIPKAAQDVVRFGTTREQQNEAFETLEEIVQHEASRSPAPRRQEPEKMSSKVKGPKRIEIELTNKVRPHEKKRVVVTHCMAPGKNFSYYTACGRPRGYQDTVCAHIEKGYNSEDWDITKIQNYKTNGKTYHLRMFGGANQKEAWEKVYEFYKGLSYEEKKAIRDWENSEEDDYDNWYDYAWGGGAAGGYPPYSTPYYYQPARAVVRVAGDEVGAQIYLKQQEKEVQRPEDERNRDIREFLDAGGDSQKKEEAVEPSRPEARGHREGPPAVTSRASDGRAPICGLCRSPRCPGCSQGSSLVSEVDEADPYAIAMRTISDMVH